MGGIRGDLAIPMLEFMHRDLQMKGKWMYSRQNVTDLIKMVEIGLLKLDGRKVERFALEDWRRAFDTAAKYSKSDGAVLVP